MKPAVKNIIIAVAAFALISGAYFFFFRPSSQPALVGTSGAPVTAAPATGDVGTEFLNLLTSVRSITLDDSIFSNQAFLSLQDYTISLVPEGNEGRVNPFAPIGVEGAPSSASSTVTITTGS